MQAFIIAGELSGDKLGAALMSGLTTLQPDITFDGVGGPLMTSQGLTSRFPMQELSLMGIAEILPKYRQLKRRIRETADAIIAAKPDVLITIDSPDFCLRVAKRVKQHSTIRTVHYVAPSVWAWRPKRAEKMATCIDQVLALLPFEPPFMQAAGMRCDFVGHPVVAEPVATATEAQAFRDTHNLGAAPLLLLLPGSRRGEVTRLAPRFGETLRAILKQRPDLKLVLPAATPVVDLVRELTANWPQTPLILDPSDHTTPELAAKEKRAAFRAADMALAASGTVSLELAAAATPMVIAYDMNWLSRQIISRMLRVDTVTLVNLVSGTRVIPEFIGARCQPDLIAPAVLQILTDPSSQFEAMALTMDRLGRHEEDPGLRAARAILVGLNASRPNSPAGI
jgi:lipid-A-disaccharide synthase